MEARKLFKFWGDPPVMTGEGDSRAEKRESSLPEAKKDRKQTDGHSFAWPGIHFLEELLFEGCLGGIASMKSHRAGLHR